MNRNLKALGVSVLAILALSGLMAGGASAKFDSEIEHTSFTTEDPVGHPHVLTVSAGTITCTTAKYTGTSVGTNTGFSWTSTDLTISADYSNCHTETLGEVHTTHVRTNGCVFTLTAGETTEGGTKVDGTTDIICPSGKVIEFEITSIPCTVTVGAQNNLPGITYHNTGSGASRDFDRSAAITTMHYVQDGFFCPGNNFSSSKTFTNGKWGGEITLRGMNTVGTQVGVWVT